MLLTGCIEPSPMNPRKTFNEDALKELADNIRSQGLLQPITVRPKFHKESGKYFGNVWEIVCGERRYRACKMAGLLEIPCIVRKMTDDEAFDAMITENLQRNDVDPIEEAVAFRLLSDRGVKADELAARFGKSVRYIQDRIRLAMLLEPLRHALSAGKITLRGAYLLARLCEDDQQAYIDDEFNGDTNNDFEFTTSDVEEWLDRYFMNLWHAPFHDGETLKESWNPDGKLIRRCMTCECNTCNHGCLFADMQTKEPQCIDSVCYERKVDIYYDWFLRQHESRFVLAGKPATAGSIALMQEDAYYLNDDDKERLKKLTDKLTSAGYRIFKQKDLPQRLWNQVAEGELHDGTAIECIDLLDMARGSQIKKHIRRIPGVEASRPADNNQPTNYPARLAERSASIGKAAEKKINNYAKKNFDRDKYVSHTGPLQDWEHVALMAIVWDKLPWSIHNELIPGSAYSSPTYQQMEKFVKDSAKDASWKRKAIAAFITSTYKESFLEEAMKHLSIEAQSFIRSTRTDADNRIKTITDELRDMGYDENANKL